MVFLSILLYHVLSSSFVFCMVCLKSKLHDIITNQLLIVAGAILALKLIDKSEAILKNYKLDMIAHDTKCQPDIVLAYFLNFLVNVTHPIAGILGNYTDRSCGLIFLMSKDM